MTGDGKLQCIEKTAKHLTFQNIKNNNFTLLTEKLQSLLVGIQIV